jgi:probable F420-dependent oxidoreductase
VTSALRFGLTGPNQREDLAALEALPIDSIWVGGHVAAPNGSPEVMVALARLAALTERVRIGTSILLLPLYPPAIVAKAVADLDRVSGGRVSLGVGIGGEYPAEFQACQIPIGERGPRTDEAIGLIRRFWTGEPVTHDGRFYPIEDVRIHPAPAQAGGPPIIVAGRQPPAMRRAALLGDGWMPYLYSPRRYAASVETITDYATGAGRDLSGFEWCAFLFVNIDDGDGDTARDETAQFLGGTYSQNFSEMVTSVAVAGTAAEVTARLQEFVDAGARHLIITTATRTRWWPVVRQLTDDVLPALTVREGI